ncbi:MAG: hypothetical protein ABIG39_04445 [Candidatus Micrarchaeota archaeon]
MRKITIDSETSKRLSLQPGDYELHEIREGVVVLAFHGKDPQKKDELSPDEFSVLRKLTEFKFEKRIPYTVNKTLSKHERDILDSLIKRGVVELYKGGKYKRTGVYNIPRKFYPLILKANKTAPPAPPKNLTPMEKLQDYGYAIISNEGEARDISRQLEKQIKAGDYLGARAFDKRFYIADRRFYIDLSEGIRRLLIKQDSTIPQISVALKTNEDACSVALILMNNDSEVIEKKKGVYGLV